jgi:glycosyltransferase involved in cell wall biosynthesis
VVLETDSVHPYDDISFADCVRALERQDYPRERIELIAVDGGKAPDVRELVTAAFPHARVLDCPGGTKFEQKNLGMAGATGQIIAFVDGDCAPPPDWLSRIARELAASPAEVAGVQGLTALSPGFCSRELSALFYGIRPGPGAASRRLVTDNCAFRREVARRFAFEHPAFSTVVDTLLLHRLRRAGYHMLLCEDLRMAHSFPQQWRALVTWFFARAWGVGYYMVLARRIEPELRGSTLVRRAGGLGWPALALAKALRDLHQVWDNRRHVGARPVVALPLWAFYELTLFLGGMGALVGLPRPRWS